MPVETKGFVNNNDSLKPETQLKNGGSTEVHQE